MEEVKVYTVAVGNFNPFKRKSRQAMEYIASIPEVIGVHPSYPRGQLILFKTENDAKIARNKMNAKGIQTGNNIGEVFIDKKYLEGK